MVLFWPRIITTMYIITFLSLVGCERIEAERALKKGLEAYKKKDYIAALKNFHLNAKLEHSRVARYYLGIMYLEGQGTPVN